MANASIGYDWRSSERLVHRVWPTEASLILTPYMSDDFREWLEGKYLFYSYQSHMIVDSRYSMIWSSKKVLKNKNFQDVRLNLETAGNLLYAGYRLFSEPPPADQSFLERCREAGVYRALLVLPPKGRDEVMPLVDEYSRFVKRKSDYSSPINSISTKTWWLLSTSRSPWCTRPVTGAGTPCFPVSII